MCFRHSSINPFARKDRRAGQQKIADRADRINIGANVDRVGMRNRLGRHVAGRPGQRVVRGEAVVLFAAERLHQAEVQNLDEVVDAAATGENQVGRLDVAVNQPAGMGFGQRAAQLPQQVHHAPLGQGAVFTHQVVEGDPFQVFHRVIKDALGRAAIVVHGNRVRMVQLAGELHLALEAGDRVGAHLLRIEQLDGGRPTEHGVPCAIHRTHSAGADLFFERVLAETSGFERRLLRDQLLPRRVDHEGENACRAQHQQPQQTPEHVAQDIERPEHLGRVGLRGHAELILRQPAPRPDGRNAAVIAKAVYIHAVVAGYGGRDEPRQRLVGPLQARAVRRPSCSLPDPAARV